MFERRVRVLLGLLGVVGAVLIARLAQLQVVQADYYTRQAEQALIQSPQSLPFVRGSIIDRNGEVLVSDEPCWNLTLDYSAIAILFETDGAALQREAKRWRKIRRLPATMDNEQVQAETRAEIDRMVSDLGGFLTDAALPLSLGQLLSRAEDVYERVQIVRRTVAQRRGFDAPIAEEGGSHALLGGLDAARQILARERLGRYPWLRVEPSSARSFVEHSEPFAHLLGRLGRVDAAAIAADPNADDPFAEYQSDERMGVSGVEFAAERILRGRRGRIVADREGNILEQVDAEHGRDVGLTLHANLQRRLYELLAETVEQHTDASGGAAVVLDVHSRDVLALVSYPSFDPGRYDELFPILRDDTDRLPLMFRAVASRYPPGSTLKPLVCLGGLMQGRITLDSRENCTGYLFDDFKSGWRCWEMRGTNQRMAHGSIDVVEALTGSCNIFMYRLGEHMGVDRLCNVFDMAGIGRGSGIGLREDEEGINPTPEWLRRHKNMAITPGTARQFAIGQGEVSMTPVQIANLMATYASGKYRPVTLIPGDQPSPEWKLPATHEQLLAIRKGIYGVVNDPKGTAYKYAHFVNDRFALCGKTGSATAHPWPTAYRVPYVDENEEAKTAIIPEASRGQAIERFRREYPGMRFDSENVDVARRWPPHAPTEGENFSHAWFGGFLQPLDAAGHPDWTRESDIAFAVLVEFGGSGGVTSGPLAAKVAGLLLEVLGTDLRVPSEPGARATGLEVDDIRNKTPRLGLESGSDPRSHAEDD